MVFGSICLGLALLSLVMYPLCCKLTDNSSALPFCVTFLIFFVAGLLSLVFSEIIGMIAMAIITLGYLIWFFKK